MEYMRKIKVLFVSIAAAFIALFALVSCSGSHATQAYSDKVNNLYSASSAITYTEALKDLGNECIDLTTKTNETHTGVLVAVKGLTKDNYEEI